MNFLSLFTHHLVVPNTYFSVEKGEILNNLYTALLSNIDVKLKKVHYKIIYMRNRPDYCVLCDTGAQVI